MRFLPVLLLLSFVSFGFVLSAAAQHAPTKKVKAKKVSKKASAIAKPVAPTAADPVLTFERTPCFGTCPAYRLLVYADGRVAYEGRRAVPLMGKHDLKLPANAVAEMLQQAKVAHFEGFEKQYTSGATDMPTTVVAIRQADGTLKKVTAETNAPENVKGYFAFLTSQFDELAQLNGAKK